MARLFIDGFSSETSLWEGGSTADSSVVSHYVDSEGTTWIKMAFHYDAGSASCAKYLLGKPKFYVAFRLIPDDYYGIKLRFSYAASYGAAGTHLQGGVQITGETIGVFDADENFVYVESDYGYAGSGKHFQVCFENVDSVNKEVTVRFDDVELFSHAWANTSGVPCDTVTTISFGGHPGVGGNYDIDLADVVIDDEDWPGESRVYGMAPSANGATIEWTPSSGENYQAVDEVPATTSDWVETAISGAIDIYESVSPLSSDVLVKSVQVQYMASSGDFFQPCFYSGESFHIGPPTSGEWTDHCLTQIWDDNPLTSGEWGLADIEEIQTGMKLL